MGSSSADQNHFESPTCAAALTGRGHLRFTSGRLRAEVVYAFDLPGIPEEKIVVDLEDSTDGQRLA